MKLAVYCINKTMFSYKVKNKKTKHTYGCFQWDFTALSGSIWVLCWTLFSFALLCAILRSQVNHQLCYTIIKDVYLFIFIYADFYVSKYLYILYASLGTLIFSVVRTHLSQSCFIHCSFVELYMYNPCLGGLPDILQYFYYQVGAVLIWSANSLLLCIIEPIHCTYLTVSPFLFPFLVPGDGHAAHTGWKAQIQHQSRRVHLCCTELVP